MHTESNKNVVDYVNEYGSFSFAQRSFCLVDALILAQLSYYKFDKYIYDGKTASLSELFSRGALPDLINGLPYTENYTSLFTALAGSARFGGITAAYHVRHTDETAEGQFSATTFFIGEETAYVSFRGTDSTVIGWKEDMNMSFMDSVPSQLEGTRYLSTVAGMTRRNLMTGGHSKGGNVALYASIKCDGWVRERITDIFDFDGPGFKAGIYGDGEYDRLGGKLVKLVPQSSVVGMLMQDLAKYRIVKSDRFWVFQHDAFSWCVKNGDFEYMDRLSVSTSVMNEAMRNWLTEFDEDGRRRVVDTLYEVFSSTGAVRISDFSVEWGKKAMKVLEAYGGTDKSVKKYISTVIGLLIKYTAVSYKDVIEEKISVKLKSLPEKTGRPQKDK